MAKNTLFFLLVGFLLLFTAAPGTAQPAQTQAQALFDLGVFAYETADYQTATQHFQAALQRNPNHAYANYYLGQVYLKTANYAQAAVYLDKARTLDPELPGLAYDWAFLNYKLKNYATAMKLFVAVVNKEPGNVLARYYTGMSLYKQADYEKALAYLNDAASRKTELRHNAAYYAGMCYLQSERLDQAEKTFTQVRNQARQTNLIRAAEKRLATVRKLQRQMKNYSLTAKTGWEYDDNEVLEPEDSSALYADEEDHILSGYVAGTYDFIKTPDWVLGAGYGHYYTQHDDFDLLDLSGSLGQVYVRHSRGNYTYSLTYSPAYYWLDSDRYLSRQEFKGTISRQIGNWLAELSYTHHHDDNFYDGDQDGYGNEGVLRCQYELPRNRGSLRADLGYQVISADHDDYDREELTTVLSANINIWQNYRVGLSAKGVFKNYDNTHSTYNTRRDDDQYVGNLILSRDLISDTLSVNLGYEYTNNNSNIADYEYESNAVKFFLIAEL